MPSETDRPQPPPLESWKAIAAYLGRDVRTVIRWEKSEGLPVHRRRHHVRSSVFAYPGEIEEWKARRELTVETAHPPSHHHHAAATLGLFAVVLMALGTIGGGAVLARAVVGAESAGIVLRQLKQPDLERTPFAQLSHDGRRMLYVRSAGAGRPADLAALDLSSGREETVVAGFGEGGFSLFRWSPDGERVVFTHERRELRLVSAHGGESRPMWTAPEPGVVVKPLDWARDGRAILVALVDETARTTRLVLLPTGGGEPEPVVSGRRGEVEDWARLSPDGRFVAGLRTDRGKGRVCVWSRRGDQEALVSEPEANAAPAFWSPDGDHLVFISDRTREKDLWAIPMRDGRARGAAFRVKQDLGRHAMLTGFTAAGQLTMVVTGEGTPSDLFVLSFDRSTGEAHGELAPFASDPTDHFSPRWSRDGSRLAYTSRKGQVRTPGVFVRPLDGRREEEIPASGYYVANVEWAPDGSSLLFPGFVPPDGQAGIFRVALDSRQVTPLHLGERLGRENQGAFVNLQWLPLARRLTFARLAGPGVELFTMDADGRRVERVAGVPTTYWTWPSPDGRHVAYRKGQELIVLTPGAGTTRALATFPEGSDVSGPAWSPDARGLAYCDTRRLSVLSPLDGVPRALVEAPPGWALGGPAWWSGIAWSPDGRTLAYLLRKVPAEAESRSELWLVPAAGGAPRRAAVAPASHPLLSDVAWHPDGTRVLATGGAAGGPVRASYQHWVMEGFLPAR
jgi:Tol biopolymer transport system component